MYQFAMSTSEDCLKVSIKYCRICGLGLFGPLQEGVVCSSEHSNVSLGCINKRQVRALLTDQHLLVYLIKKGDVFYFESCCEVNL